MKIRFASLILFIHLSSNSFGQKLLQKLTITSLFEMVDSASINKNGLILGIGESVHGAKEFNELRFSLLEKSSPIKFSCMAIEMPFHINLDLFDFLNNPNSSISVDSIIRKIDFFYLKTEEFKRELIILRENNNNTSIKNNIVGIDIQNLKANLELFDKSVLIQKSFVADKDIAELREIIAKRRYNEKKEKNNFLNKIENLKKTVGDGSVCLKMYSEIERKFLIRLIEIIPYSYTLNEFMLNKNILAATNYRDSIMFENTIWAINLFSGNIILAAHNGHISKINYEEPSLKTVGGYLSSQTKFQYIPVGVDFKIGKFVAKKMNEDKVSVFELIQLKRRDIYEQFQIDNGFYFTTTSIFGENKKIEIHDIGASYNPENNSLAFIKIIPKKCFDFIILFNKASSPKLIE